MLDVLESCSTKRFRDFLQKVRMVDFGDFLSFSMSFGKMIFVCFSPFFFFFFGTFDNFTLPLDFWVYRNFEAL